MRTSESIALIAPALLAVQKEGYKVEKASTNPFHHSKYADLAKVAETMYPLLHKNGLVMVQGFDDTNVGKGEQLVVTRIIHAASGEWIESRLKLDAKTQDPQGHGSAATYGRRYSLMAILGLVGEDDDAEKAMGSYRKPVQQPQAVQPPRTQSQMAAPTTAPQADKPVRGDKGEVVKEHNPATGQDEVVMQSDVCPQCKTGKISEQVKAFFQKTKPGKTPICYDCQKKGS